MAANTTDVLSASRARPKAESRRSKADVKRDFGLGAFRRPAQNHARRPKADVVKVRPGLIDESPDWLGLAWLGFGLVAESRDLPKTGKLEDWEPGGTPTATNHP